MRSTNSPFEQSNVNLGRGQIEDYLEKTGKRPAFADSADRVEFMGMVVKYLQFSPAKSETPEFCRIVPRAFQQNRRPRLHLAVVEETEQLIALIALWKMPGFNKKRVAEFLFRAVALDGYPDVDPNLIERLVVSARKGRVRELVTENLVAEGSHFEQFLRSHGFDREKVRLTSYEILVDKISAVLEPLFRRLKERGKIPSEARIVSLSEASPNVLQKFVLSNLGWSIHNFRGRLGQREGAFENRVSSVLLVGNEVSGVQLGRTKSGIKISDGFAVAPKLRGGWANIYLRYDSLTNLREYGIDRVQFMADESEHRDTVKMVNRFEGRILGRFVKLGRLIE